MRYGESFLAAAAPPPPPPPPRPPPPPPACRPTCLHACCLQQSDLDACRNLCKDCIERRLSSEGRTLPLCRFAALPHRRGFCSAIGSLPRLLTQRH